MTLQRCHERMKERCVHTKKNRKIPLCHRTLEKKNAGATKRKKKPTVAYVHSYIYQYISRMHADSQLLRIGMYHRNLAFCSRIFRFGYLVVFFFDCELHFSNNTHCDAPKTISGEYSVTVRYFARCIYSLLVLLCSAARNRWFIGYHYPFSPSCEMLVSKHQPTDQGMG